jgi:hypothetical protein
MLPSQLRSVMPKDTFRTIKKDTVLHTRFMDDCLTTSRPYIKHEEDDHGIPIIQDCINVKFINGPWKGQDMELIRHQIYRKK